MAREPIAFNLHPSTARGASFGAGPKTCVVGRQSAVAPGGRGVPGDSPHATPPGTFAAALTLAEDFG